MALCAGSTSPGAHGWLDGVTLLVAPEGGVEVAGLVLDPQDVVDVGEQPVEVRGTATVLIVEDWPR